MADLTTSTCTQSISIVSNTCSGETETSQKKSNKSPRRAFFRKWFAVFPGFVCSLLGDGFIYHMSSLFLDLQNEFHTSKAETSIVQSVASGTSMIGGIFAGLIITKFGIYKAGFLAASLECLGLSISYFSPNIPFLVFSLGVLTAFGTSLTYNVGCTVVDVNFQGTDQVIAFSVMSVGEGIGAMSFSYIINYLSLTYGWRGAMLILSAIMSHLFVIILLSQKMHGRKAMQSNKNETGILKKLVFVLKNKLFMLFIIVVASQMAVLTIMLIYHVDYFQTKGYTRSTSVFFYFSTNLVSAVTVLLPGILKKLLHCDIFHLQAGSIMFGAFGYGLLPVASSYGMDMTFNCLIGLFQGFGNALYSACPAKILDEDHYSIGLGLLATLTGIFVFMLGPLAGLVKDLSGTYDWLFYGVGVYLIVCTLFMVGIAVKRNRRKTLKYGTDGTTEITKESVSAISLDILN